MTIQTLMQGAASGENMTAHTMTAATLGGGFSTTVIWAIETFGHVKPPESVDQWLTAACIFVASYIMQKMV